MTPLVLALALAGDPGDGAFGERSAGRVRSVDPDTNHHQGDGAYGRFDGDLSLGLGAGGTLAPAGGNLGAAFRATARWYETAGLYALYGETLARHPDIERRLGLGLELTPLFLVRWSQALEAGPAALDLALDSIALGAGGSLSQKPGRDFASRGSFELSLGFGVPLAGSAPGPWLEFRAALPVTNTTRGDATLALLFSWRFALTTPLVHEE
jgi:hypothetical protein